MFVLTWYLTCIFLLHNYSQSIFLSQAKKSTDSINSKLALVIKSGKYTLGYRSTLRTLREVQKAKVVVIADNCPPLQKSEIGTFFLFAFSCP